MLSRFLRWLAKAEGCHIEVDDADWDILANMGSGSVGGVGDSGISNYQDAAATCFALTALGAASGAKYGLDDLVCFLCLSKHREAVETEGLPTPAPPVSVRDDLDLEPPQPVVQRAPQLRTRWKKLYPKPPSQKPNLGDAMLELIRWPHIAAASSLSMCCRAFNGCVFLMTRRRAEIKRTIADSVAFQLSPEAPAFFILSVSKPALFILSVSKPTTVGCQLSLVRLIVGLNRGEKVKTRYVVLISHTRLRICII